MGWITKVKGKRVGARYKVGWRDAARRPHYKTFSRQRDALTFLREIEHSKQAGTYLDPNLGKMTFQEFFDHFLATSADLRPSTVARYRTHGRLYLLPALGPMPLNAIETGFLKTFATELRDRVGQATMEATYRLLRRVLNVAVEEGRIGRNPAIGVRAPRARRREPRFLTAQEVSAIANEVPARYRALIYLLAYGGLRIGEAAALQVTNVDLLRGRVLISEAAAEVEGRRIVGETKTGRIRTVVLPSFLREVIAEHINALHPQPHRGDLVFTAEEGGPVRQANFRNRVFYPACRRAGIEPIPHVHDLRHTAVALAIQAGAHPQAIKEMAGHSNIATTFDVYGHLFETLHEQTADRLDEIFRATSRPSLPLTLDRKA
jgi:integrase